MQDLNVPCNHKVIVSIAGKIQEDRTKVFGNPMSADEYEYRLWQELRDQLDVQIVREMASLSEKLSDS